MNKQAIREVLGSLLQNPSLIREYKILQNDFPETFHKLIFAAINNLYKNKKPRTRLDIRGFALF